MQTYWITIAWNLAIASVLVSNSALIGGDPKPALIGLFVLALLNACAAISFLREPESKTSKLLGRFYR